MDGSVILLLAILGGALVSLGSWWGAKMRDRTAEALSAAAKELGLEYVDRPRGIHGEIGGIAIDGRYVRDAFRLRVDGLPSTIRVAPERLTMTPDIRTGDDDFDRAVRVEGEASTARALLDARTREVLRRTVRSGIRLEDGALTLAYAGEAFVAQFLVRDVRAMIEIAAAMRAHYPVEGRVRGLVRNATEDVLPEVRLRCLETLVGEHRDDPAAAPGFEAALASDDARTRLLGAIGLGRTDLLAELRRRPHPDAIRERALRETLFRLPPHEAEREALAVLAESDAGEDLWHAAIDALAKIGTAKSVAALREHAGVLSSMGRAASAAIDAIQVRLVGASPGQIALADEGEAGAVSLPNAEAGAVSLPAAPKKQSS